MKWQGGRRSSNVDDRRGRSGGGRSVKLGGGVTIIVLVVGLFLGADPLQMLNMLGNLESGGTGSQTSQPVPKNDEQTQFVSVVLADTEDVWNKLFTEGGEQYR